MRNEPRLLGGDIVVAFAVALVKELIISVEVAS
jgi:hypothetical protein